MEKVLRKNDNKVNWKSCSLEYLELKLLEEVAEYFSNKSTSDNFFVITKFVTNLSTFKNTTHKPKKEMIDIANVAMMIRDNLITIKQWRDKIKRKENDKSN